MEYKYNIVIGVASFFIIAFWIPAMVKESLKELKELNRLRSK